MKRYTVVLKDSYTAETRELKVYAVNTVHASLICIARANVGEYIILVKEVTQ